MSDLSSTEKTVVFVTGATGFVGRNLVEKLIETGRHVRCLVRKSSRAEYLSKMPEVEVFWGELSDEALLSQCISGVQEVYHVAGCVATVHFKEMQTVNVVYTEKIVKICSRQKVPPVMIFVSSLAAAGPSPKNCPHVEGGISAPVSYYGASKLSAEKVLRHYAHMVPITVIRPGIVFGPHDIHFQKWIESVQRMGIFFVPAYRRMYFSMVYVTDLLRVMITAAERGERLSGSHDWMVETDMGRGIYYAPAVGTLSYLQMGRVLGTAVGRRRVITLAASPIIFYLICQIGGIFAKFTGKTPILNPDKYREALAGSWACCCEKAASQLGVTSEMSLEEALKKTVEFITDKEKTVQKTTC
ncbi:MAG: NAD-dependent epimerase/dehydratase family protein [Planctomycetia bacterium]|nr:NAD-dependent epimerase/dehydratase family protein [Planctomycetia bacterium]